MLKFCGIFVSDPRHLKCATAVSCPTCQPMDARFRGRLGLGYYSGNEVLLMRRPVGHDLGLLQMIGPAVGNHVLFGLDDSPSTQFRLEHTPPFRYRSYLGLVSVGPVRQPDFAEKVRFHIPDSLKRDVKTDNPAELLFHLVLSNVHDMGRMGDPAAPPAVLAEAAASALNLLPKLLEGPAPAVALCIANGRNMVAAAVGTDLWMSVLDGIPDCPLCSEPERTPGKDPVHVAHPSVKLVAFAHTEGDAVPCGFTRVPAGQIVTASATGEVTSKAL